MPSSQSASFFIFPEQVTCLHSSSPKSALTSAVGSSVSVRPSIAASDDFSLSSRDLSFRPTFQHLPENDDTRLKLQRSLRPQLTKYKFWIGAAMAVQEYLPGSPTKRLVKLILRKYGIKPRGQQWRATWFEEFSAPERSPCPERSPLSSSVRSASFEFPALPMPVDGAWLCNQGSFVERNCRFLQTLPVDPHS